MMGKAVYAIHVFRPDSSPLWLQPIKVTHHEGGPSAIIDYLQFSHLTIENPEALAAPKGIATLA